MSDSPTIETGQVTPPSDATQAPFYNYPGKKSPPPLQKRWNKAGCFLMSILTAFMVTVLVVIGLFVPPISLGDRLFGTRYVQLDSINNAIALNSPTGTPTFTLIVSPNDIGQNFGVALTRMNLTDFLNTPSTTDSWTALARATLPTSLALKSEVVSIVTDGIAPKSATLTFALPTDSQNPDLIDVYAWDESTSQWQFIPSRLLSGGLITATVHTIPNHIAVFEAQPTESIIATVLDINQLLPPEYPSLIDIVMPVGIMPIGNSSQTLVGSVVGGFELGASYRVMPIIRNYNDPRAIDVDSVIRIITNPDLQATHITQLAGFATAGGYSGIFIDYTEVPAIHRASFTQFVQQLGSTFKGLGLRLGVVVSSAQNIEGRWETGAYDWAQLGHASDFIQIRYDLNPTIFATGRDRLVEAMTRWAVGEVSRNKLLAGLSAMPIRETSGSFTPISYDESLVLLGDVRVENLNNGVMSPGQQVTLSLSGADALIGSDTTIQSPFVDYLADNGASLARIWLTTDSALRFRMDGFRPFALRGIGFYDLLNTGTMNGVLGAVQGYKIQLPSTQETFTDLALNWRIESLDGVVQEFTTSLGETIDLTLIAPDGNYAVNVDVVGAGDTSARRGVAVAVAQPTITPTLLAQSTPRPFPTPTPTLMAIVPTDSVSMVITGLPPTTGGGVAIRPGSGSILRGFEYGGHVTSAGSQRAISAMQSAGMTWMKVQLRYGTGSTTAEAAEIIRVAHGNGFKILIGIVGLPNQMGDIQSYIPQFARFLGDVAALGPDAIEVWNEPNLDREWPRGQISGATFASLLRASYQEIKARNPNVVVIAGAPAPTGAEGAFPGQVINDDRFVRDMVNAGAINYMDCMGVHYNEGIVPPKATSGDPRGDYYTRYLPSLIDTYWSLVGGRVPLCITELGYLTPEGLGPLAPFFGWGGSTTVEQQAAWLAGAASYSSQTGRVRLMIVWNVDFTRYDDDPMAGFAIIRPDGSCPACSALYNAR
ncbi:MAG: hypothetical protein SH821_14310 [Phototrophicales bacterium]|nr:hypothetical protein [Phototrophicales bacterium]